MTRQRAHGNRCPDASKVCAGGDCLVDAWPRRIGMTKATTTPDAVKRSMNRKAPSCSGARVTRRNAPAGSVLKATKLIPVRRPDVLFGMRRRGAHRRD